MKYLLLFSFFVQSLFAYENTLFTVEEPIGWQVKPVKAPLLFFANPPDTFKGNPNKVNMVITQEKLAQGQAELFKNDPVTYLKIILGQSFPGLIMQTIEKKKIGGYDGVYILSDLEINGGITKNLQYYFLHNNILHSIIYSSESDTFFKHHGKFEKSLHSLKRK